MADRRIVCNVESLLICYNAVGVDDVVRHFAWRNCTSQRKYCEEYYPFICYARDVLLGRTGPSYFSLLNIV